MRRVVVKALPDRVPDVPDKGASMSAAPSFAVSGWWRLVPCDFAAPVSGTKSVKAILTGTDAQTADRKVGDGGYSADRKLGLDATNKWPRETQREWGRPIVMDAAVQARVDGIFQSLGL